MSRALRLCISVTLLAWIALRTDWAKVKEAFAGLRIELWLAAVAIGALCQVVSAIRWRRMCHALGFERPLSQFVSLYFVGTFFNLVLPTSVGGDVVRVWYLDNGSGRRLPAFLTVFLDRLSGLMVLLTMACLAVALSPFPLRPWIPLSVWGMTAGALGVVILLPIGARWLRLSDVRIGHIDAALKVLRQPRLFLETTALSAIVQAGSVLLVWLVGLSLEAEIPGSFYWIMAPMVSLLTMLPISVNGMGVREHSTVLLLAPLGVDPAKALILALLSFAASAAISLMGGIVYMWGRLPRPTGAADSNPENSSDGPLDHYPDQGRTREPRQAA